MPSKSAVATRDFAQRFRDAITRRAYPNTAMHLKQFSGIAGYSRDSFMRWWRGEARIPGDAVDALVTYFEGAGDRAFLHEVFGQRAAAMDAELDALKRRIAEMELELKGSGHAAVDDRLRPVAARDVDAAGDGADPASGEVGAAPASVDGDVTP